MAALNMEDFKEAQASGLSLFSVPPYQSAVERMYYQEVRSNSQLTGNIIDMEITGKHGMEYVDLKRSKLYVKAKIVKADGNKIAADEYVGPINLFLQHHICKLTQKLILMGLIFNLFTLSGQYS